MSPSAPFEAIIFDCDGTLSSIEGIDFLAAQRGVNDVVSQLTAEAMGKSGLTPELYQQRLQLVSPTQQQVQQLGQDYFARCVPDIAEVIQLLTRLNKSIYVISAGLYPAVAGFAERLNIPQENIFAVDIAFDSAGEYLDFDHASPLVHNDGKRTIVSELSQKFSRIAYVGDGLNDLTVIDIVTKFIGYGGIFYRENIAQRCQHYLTHASMSALLPLVLTYAEVQDLFVLEGELYNKGLALK